MPAIALPMVISTSSPGSTLAEIKQEASCWTPRLPSPWLASTNRPLNGSSRALMQSARTRTRSGAMSMWRSPSWSGEQCQFLGRIETGGDRRLLRFRVLRHGLEVLLTPPLRVAGDMARVTAHGDGGSTPISGPICRDQDSSPNYIPDKRGNI